jgi:hypothetical protein
MDAKDVADASSFLSSMMTSFFTGFSIPVLIFGVPILLIFLFIVFSNIYYLILKAWHDYEVNHPTDNHQTKSRNDGIDPNHFRGIVRNRPNNSSSKTSNASTSSRPKNIKFKSYKDLN